MNTPPGQQPFSQYGTPPPGNYTPPRSNSNGCWKAGGITCGVLLVLGIIAVVIGGLAVKKALHNRTGIFGKVMDIATTTTNGITIQKAVVKYHADHGKYPTNLTQLVADGDIDGKILHSSLDPNPDPGHISWTYHQPTETSAPNTPLLTMHVELNIPGANTQQTSNSDIVINLDGTSASNENSSTGTHVETHTGSP